jgi:hypothetical protein
MIDGGIKVDNGDGFQSDRSVKRFLTTWQKNRGCERWKNGIGRLGMTWSTSPGLFRSNPTRGLNVLTRMTSGIKSAARICSTAWIKAKTALRTLGRFDVMSAVSTDTGDWEGDHPMGVKVIDGAFRCRDCDYFRKPACCLFKDTRVDPNWAACELFLPQGVG